MAAVMAKKEADAEYPSGTNTASSGEAHRHRHGRPALRQPSFNWNVPNKYVELLCFEMEVMNILQTKTYKLTVEGKVPMIKNWLGRERQLIQTFKNTEKEVCKTVEGLLSTLGKNQANMTMKPYCACSTAS